MFKKMWKWFKKIFKRDTVKPTLGYGGLPTPKPTWGIIVGHTKSSPGAYTANERLHEYGYYSKMVTLLDRVHHEKRDIGGVEGACKRLKAKGVNTSIECHFNAYNGYAKGCEILVLENDFESERLARFILDDFKTVFPSRVLRGDNGIKWIKKRINHEGKEIYDRGYWNLAIAKKYMNAAILTELFFGDNKHDIMACQIQADFFKRHFYLSEKK